MSFQLNNEQKMIQKTAREFARKVLSVTAAERDVSHEYPAENLKKMGELGFLGLLVSEKNGGTAAGTIAYSLALSEMAYSCASTAVIMSVHSSICCNSIEKYGSEEQKKEFLEPMAAGDFIGAFALTEPEAGSDPRSLSCFAEKRDDSYIINGVKRFITTGKNSGVIILLAKTGDDEISAFLITHDLPGFEVGRIEDKMGQCASDTTDLLFNNCVVPAERMLGKRGEGFKIAMSGLDAGRIGIASVSLGIAEAALDETVNYVKQRKQFGKRIADFQGIRWMLADMAIDVQSAKHFVMNAATVKERGEYCTAEAAMAKCFASEMVQRVTGQAIQLHGGYGYIKEYPVERFYRDARITTIYEGTNQIQRIIIANELLKDKKNKQ